jgi:hypothetical protein
MVAKMLSVIVASRGEPRGMAGSLPTTACAQEPWGYGVRLVASRDSRHGGEGKTGHTKGDVHAGGQTRYAHL